MVAALSGLLVGDAAAQPRPPESPGPIWLEIQATREELDRVMAIARRLNARLRDDSFLAEVTRASIEQRYDDLADLVADAAGVSPSWVNAGPGEAEVRTSGPGGGSPALPRPRLAARAGPARTLPVGLWMDDRALSAGPESPWYLRYQSRSWTWCIAVGACPGL